MRNRNSLLYKGIIASFFYLLIAADLYGQCSVNAGNDTTICQGQRFVRTATFTGSSSSIRWYNKSNPSNDLSTNATINIVRNVPGKDTIVIRVDGTGSNCPDTDTVVVTVNSSPSINIGANQTLCQNDVESITATFSPANGIINWYLLGSTTSSGTGPTFIIPTNSSGTFNYVAKIDSAGICSDFDTVRIVVDPRPNASFTFNPSTGCGRTRVTFTNTSNNGSGSTSGLSYNWNFGDGNTSTQTNPSHTFNPGRGSGNATFPVRLIVTNSSGCKDTSTININIGKTPDPTLNGPGSTIFNGQSYFKICASAASNFGFTNGSSTASTNTNYVIKWGDGTPDTSFNTFTTVVRHLYSVGSKKLTFIVYSGSCVDSTVYNVFVGNVPAGGIVGVGGSTICAGDAQNFVINGIANNPVGTVYIVDYKDGTKIDTFFHPAPDTITHLFPRSSCGTNNSNGSTVFNNSFGAYLSIINPCGSAGGSVLPIYVSDKPDPQISATRDSICELQDITFTNTGNAGNNVESGACTPGKGVWEISSSTPGASWIAISGDPSLGNDFDDPDPNLWNPGATSINVRFNTKGIYTVRLVMANNTLCGRDTAIKTICVNPQPTANFNLNKDIDCAPFNVNATGITNVPTCGTNRFQWSVSYAPTTGCTPATSGFSYVGGTNENSQNPQFQFTNPGVYTISLITIAPGGACSSQVVQKQVTVKSRPVVTLNPINPTCQNDPITPSATATCYTTAATYSWSFNGGNPSSSNQLIPGQIRYTSAGNYNVVFSATNECGTSNTNQPITIKPLPSVSKPADIVRCSGETVNAITFSGSPVANTTYTWSTPTTSIGLLPTSGSNSIPQFTATNNTNAPITATITVTPTADGCPGPSITFTITVNPRPTVSAVTAQSVCNGQPTTAIIFGGSSVSGTTYSWTNDRTSIGLAASGNGNIAAFNAVNTGTSPVTANINVTPTANNCQGSVVTATITVNPTPTANTIPNRSVCNGNLSAAIPLSGAVANTVFDWANDNPSIGLGSSGINATSIPQFTATNNTSAPIIGNIRVTPKANNCTGAPVNFTITVNPAPTVAFNIPNQTICSETSSAQVTLTSPTTGANIGWTATIPAGITGTPAPSTSGTTIIPAQNFVNNTGAPLTINYVATATTSGGVACPGSTFTHSITINPKPTVTPNPVTSIICSGATANINFTTNFTSGVTYSWTIVPNANVTGASNGSGLSISQILNNTSTTPQNITYNITPTFTSSTLICPGLTSQATVTVNPIPSVNQPSNVIVCNTSSTGPINFTGNATRFDWVANPPAIGISPASGSGAIPTFTSANNTNAPITSNVRVTPFYQNSNGGPVCSGSFKDFTITVNPTAQVNQINNITVCNNADVSAISFGSTVVSGVTYTWSNNTTSIGLGASGTGNIPTFRAVNTTNQPIIATITVTPNYTNPGGGPVCPGTPRTFTITVNPTPAGSVTPISQIICSGNSTSLSLSSSVSSGMTYSWTPSANSNISGAAPVTASATASIVQTLTNSSATAQSINYTITPIFTNNNVACSGSTFTATVTVNPGPSVNQISDVTLCNNQSSTLINLSGPVSGTTFAWTNDNTNIGLAASGNTNIPVFTATNSTNAAISGLITVTPSFANTGGGSACPGTPRTFRIYVNPTPSVSLITPPIICSGGTTNIQLSSNVSTGVSYTWTSSSNTNITGAASGSGGTIAQTLTNTSLTPQNITYTVSPTVTFNTVSCPGTTRDILVTVNPKPTVSSPAGQTLCAGDVTQVINLSGTVNNTVFEWTVDRTGIGLNPSGSSNPIPAFTAANTGNTPINATITIVPTFTNTAGGQKCSGDPVTTNIIINPKPVVTVPSNITVCNGRPTGPLSFSSNVTGAVFSWTNDNTVIGLAANGTGNISSFVATNSTNNPITANITVTPEFTNNGIKCVGDPKSFTITVNPAPRVNFTPTDQTICSGEGTQAVSIQSPTQGVSIPWTVAVPAGITGINTISGNTTIPAYTITNTTALPVTVSFVAQANIGTGTNGCSGDQSTYTITVNPRPKIANIVDVICSEGTFTVTPSSSITGNIIPSNTTYTWSAADNPNVTGESNNTSGVSTISGTLTNISDASQVVVYTVTPKSGAAGNCEGPKFTITVTINPRPKISDTTITICSEGSYSITRRTWGSDIVPSGTKFSWSAPIFSNPGAITVINGGAGIDLTTISGQLRNNTTTQQWAEFIVTPKGVPGDCPGDVFKVRIIVNPRPTIQPISDVICSEGTFSITPSATLTNNIIPANTTYTWTFQDNPNVTGEQSQTNPSLSVISGTLTNRTNIVQQVLYSVTPISGALGNCPGQPFTLTINVDPKPKILDTTLTICSGTSFNYTPLHTPPSMLVPAGTIYSWSAPVVTGGLIGGVAGTGTGNITGSLSNPTSAVQTATYTVTPKSGNCTGPDFKVTVRVNPAPGVIFAPNNQKICSGDNTLAVTLTSSSSGVSIPWQATQPAGITGIIANGFDNIPVQTLINNTPNPITITYTATAQTTGSATCSGAPGTYTIVVNPRPKIANITQAICSDSFFTVTPSVNVSGNIIPAGTTYTWPAPTVSTAGTITGTRAGNAQSLITDTLKNLTNQVQTVTYTVTPTSGIADSCKGNPFTITVTVYPTPVIPTQYDTICTGETFLLNPQNGNPNANVIVPNGTRYSWSAPSAPPGIGGVVSGANQPTITGVLTNTTFVPETIEYTVTPTSGIAGACQGKPFKVFVTVNPLSSISNNPRSQAVCTENTTNAVNWTSFTPNSSFAWTLVSSGSIIGFVPSGSGPTLSAMTLKNVGVDVDSLVYSVTSTASACAAPATLYKIYVYPDAEAKFDAPIDTACWPFNIPIRNTSPATANGDYKWYANGNLIGSGTNFPGYTIQGPDDNITIKMVAISKYGCRADSISKSFYTYKQPDASFTSSIDKACGPLSVYFTNTSTFNSTFKYEWDFGNGRTSTRYQPDSIYYVTNPNFGDTVYTVTLKAFNQCDTLRFTKQIIVQSKPLSRFLPNKTTGCSPLTVVYNNSSLGVGNTYIWDFGDGSPTVTTSVKDSMTHTYFVGVKTTFIVKLIAINACGSDTSKFNLVVTPNPIKLDFAVLGTEQNGCAPLTVRFFNKTSGADIFKWDFGTGDILSTTKNIDTVTYTFQNPGRYTVKLQATSICSDTSSTEIIDVFDKAVPKFTPSTLTRCIGDSIKFTNQTTGGATGYLWKFGDGNTSTLVSPGHKYAQSGTYTVTLIAFKNQPTGVTCVDSVKIRVSIIDTLPIDFGISSTLGKCRPFKVTFTNTFLNYKSIEWDFGDGTKKGIGDVVEHIYTQNGTYNVRLTIVAEGGCTYTAVKQITVAAPDGTIRVQTGFNCQDDNIRFEAIPVNTDAIFWSFGDGKTLTTPNRVVFHKYLNPGTYFASAEFLTNEGCRYTVPGTYEIKIDRIVPGFKYVQAEECGSTKVRFIDTSNVFFGKSSIEWNFGDGTKGSGAEITHSYTATGTYVVQQIIKGNSGCSDTIQSSVQVIVRSVPNAEITNDPVICTNTDVRFGSVVTSTDPVNFYKWNFSNGTNSDKDALIVRFANAGNITVQFIAGTIYGCYDTTRKTLKINQTPTVRAAPDATICKGQSVNLIASGALNYTWSPTDYLSNPNIANPVSKPDVTTPYTVKGLSAEGCSAYDTINITVIQPFKISVMPGDSICIGQSIRLLASGAYRYEWSPAATLNQSNIPNPLATPVATTNYRVVGFDEYGCFNDTGYVLVGVGLYPVVNLGPDLTLSTGTLQKLTSTITNGPIEQWLWTPPINLNCSTCPEPTALIKNDIEYKLKVTNFFGCSGEDVMRIKVFCEETQVYIPNAFSPDGDGRNDVFMVRGKGIMQVKSMRIFNRWGDLVFEKTNITPNDPAGGWDGRVRGANIGPDVFAYIVEVVCDNGVPYFYKGNVTLLK